ncbi:MAG: DciA family protein [Bacteroidales bacterium]|jgi:hypothetical protein|nr:DciA family protein [Bacteroidales bacterium]
MAYDSRKNGLRRQEAVGMEELVAQFIRDMKLSSGLGRQRACEAWAKVSGAGRYTLDVSFDRGVMVCVISSSVVRNQLYFRREKLLKSLNEHLASDALLAGSAEGDIVKTLILR